MDEIRENYQLPKKPVIDHNYYSFESDKNQKYYQVCKNINAVINEYASENKELAVSINGEDKGLLKGVNVGYGPFGFHYVQFYFESKGIVRTTSIRGDKLSNFRGCIAKSDFLVRNVNYEMVIVKLNNL